MIILQNFWILSKKSVKMNKEDKLRKEISDKVKELYNIKKERERFIPGKSRVNYSGRVYDEKEMQAVVDSCLDFWLTLGKEGKKFCEDFSKYLGVNNVLVTNSGSSANLLAIAALCSRDVKNHLKEGDEVITTALNFPTTITPIIQNNMIPVLVDCEVGSNNIDVDKIEDAISPKTRAIIIAHTLGNPVEMDKLMKIAKKHKLFVIEDTCDALGSKYDGKLCGTFGDISTYSFYAAHHITMGEGGACATDNQEIYRTMLSIRDWGRGCYCETGEKNPLGACNNRFGFKYEELPEGYDHKYIYTNLGYNLKPLDIQCAIGIQQLKKLEGFIKRRKDSFENLNGFFQKYEKCFILPTVKERAEPSWFAFPLTVRKDADFSRKDIVKYLEKNMIETRMIFAGNILRQPGFKDMKCRIVGSLENSDYVAENSFFIGVYPGITKEKMEYIKDKLKEFLDM